ncbi:MAG: glycosyltransferase family 39 protein [Devosia sp.]|nr:glycosyltransferase family 39 protein [Devosia sp.]
MMEHYLGIAALVAAGAASLAMAARQPGLTPILGAAFIVRAAAALYHFYVAPLPDGLLDAVKFERVAWESGSHGLSIALSGFPRDLSYFYSYLLGLVYSVTGRAALMAQSFGILAGTAGVALTWALANDLWGRTVARRAAWVAALFPTAIMYSALTMREPFVMLFLLLGLRGAVAWARSRRMLPAAGAMAGFAAAALFHTGLIAAVAIFAALVLFGESRRLMKGWIPGLILAVCAGAIVVGAAAALLESADTISIGKFGTLTEAASPERWLEVTRNRTTGGAAYPEWTTPRSAADLIWAVPLRLVYFLFSPFPWDVRTPAHLSGLLDSLLYAGLAWYMWKNRGRIWADPAARLVLLIVLPLLLAFAIGTGNFGTAMRHRSKLLPVLAVLAAPALPRLVLHAKGPNGRAADAR